MYIDCFDVHATKHLHTPQRFCPCVCYQCSLCFHDSCICSNQRLFGTNSKRSNSLLHWPLLNSTKVVTRKNATPVTIVQLVQPWSQDFALQKMGTRCHRTHERWTTKRDMSRLNVMVFLCIHHIFSLQHPCLVNDIVLE